MRKVLFKSEEHVESDWSPPVRSTMLAGVADVGVSEEEATGPEEEEEEEEEEAAATAAAAANSVKSDTGNDRGRRTTDNSGTV